MAFQGHAMLRKKNPSGAVFEHNESSISTKSNQRQLPSTSLTSIVSNSHYKIPGTKPSKQLLPTHELIAGGDALYPPSGQGAHVAGRGHGRAGRAAARTTAPSRGAVSPPRPALVVGSRC